MSKTPAKVPTLRSFRCIGPIGQDVEALDAESAAHIFQLIHGSGPVQVVGDGKGPVWTAGVCEHGGVHLRSSTRDVQLVEPGKVGCKGEGCRYASPELHRKHRVLAVLALTRRMAELCGTAPEGGDATEGRLLLQAEHDIARAFANLCGDLVKNSLAVARAPSRASRKARRRRHSEAMARSRNAARGDAKGAAVGGRFSHEVPVSLSSQPALPLAEGELCSGCDAPAIGRRIHDAEPLCWSCCQVEGVDTYRFDPSAVSAVLAYLAEVLCALSSLDQPPFLEEARHRLGLGDPAGWSEDHFRAVLRYFDGTANGGRGGTK